MACSLIEHKRINTTLAKAKALKKFIEPLITKSKVASNPTSEKGVHNRRVVYQSLRSKDAVTELFGPVAEKVGDRPGGYTRIIKLGNRLGDNADMAMIELVDFNELYTAGEKKAKSTRRSRRGKGKSEGSKTEQAAPAAEVTEAEAISTESAATEEAITAEVDEQQVAAEEAATPEEAKMEEAPQLDAAAGDEDSTATGEVQAATEVPESAVEEVHEAGGDSGKAATQEPEKGEEEAPGEGADSGEEDPKKS